MHQLLTDDGAGLAYRRDGLPAGPPLVLINSLGTDLRMWDAQLAALGERLSLARYDARGHGGASAGTQPVTIERLGRDLLALLDQLGLARASLCGVSLGGLTAQWLAIHHPARVERLVLANTAARIGSAESWATRIAAVQAGGMAAIQDTTLERFFSASFQARQPALVARFAATLEATDPAGYMAACAALRDADLRPLVARIKVPTLVIAGELDVATTPAQAAELSGAIAGSELAMIAGAAHLSNLEQPEQFNGLLLRFLSKE